MSSNTYPIGARLIMAAMFLLVSTSALAGDRGSVTAIASMSAQISSFVGFSSGAVLYCTRKGGCTELAGTSNSPVTAIDTPRGGDSVRVWVGYEDGSVLFCTLTGGCIAQDLQAQSQIVPKRNGSDTKIRFPSEMN